MNRNQLLTTEEKQGCGCVSALGLVAAVCLGLWLGGIWAFVAPIAAAASIAALMAAGLADRRKQLVEKEAAAPTVDQAQHGGPLQLRFVYEDGSGMLTERRVSDWVEHGDRLTGFCEHSQAERTFRKDRILEWLDGTEHWIDRP